MSSSFSWALALHIVAFVFWLAALFSLSGLLVQHAQAYKEGDVRGCGRFAVMEKRLYRGVINPAMLAVIVLGIVLLIMKSAVLTQGWFYTKIALVVILIGFQHICMAHIKKLAADKGRSPLFYRGFVGAPILLLIAIVVLSKLHPF